MPNMTLDAALSGLLEVIILKEVMDAQRLVELGVVPAEQFPELLRERARAYAKQQSALAAPELAESIMESLTGTADDYERGESSQLRVIQGGRAD